MTSKAINQYIQTIKEFYITFAWKVWKSAADDPCLWFALDHGASEKVGGVSATCKQQMAVALAPQLAANLPSFHASRSPTWPRSTWANGARRGGTREGYSAKWSYARFRDSYEFTQPIFHSYETARCTRHLRLDFMTTIQFSWWVK